MSGSEKIEERLRSLEEKLAFQEDLIDQLNEVVSEQSFDLRKLWDANRFLRQKLDESKGSDAEGNDGPPPHY